MRRRRKEPAPVPFTPEEDAAVREMIGCGLSSDFWHIGLPGRKFGEIAAHALDNRIERAKLI